MRLFFVRLYIRLGLLQGHRDRQIKRSPDSARTQPGLSGRPLSWRGAPSERYHSPFRMSVIHIFVLWFSFYHSGSFFPCDFCSVFLVFKPATKCRLYVAILATSMPKHSVSVSVAEARRQRIFSTRSPQQLDSSGSLFLDMMRRNCEPCLLTIILWIAATGGISGARRRAVRTFR